MAACTTAECKAAGLCFPRSGHCVEDEHFMVRPYLLWLYLLTVVLLTRGLTRGRAFHCVHLRCPACLTPTLTLTSPRCGCAPRGYLPSANSTLRSTKP